MGYRIKRRGRYYWLYGRVKGIRLDRSLKTTVKAEAEEIAKGIVRRTLETAFGVRVVKDINLKALMEKYGNYCADNNRRSTYLKKRFNVRNILAYFGDVPLRAVTPERIESFKTTRRTSVSPATVNRDLSTLKHALGLAVSWGYLEASPAARVAKFREPNGRVRYLTRREAEGLLKACSDELRPLVAAALNTGMRLGELLALDWSHVDLQRRQIRVVDSKNNESRVVPTNAVLYNTLSAIQHREGAVFVSRYGRGYNYVYNGFRAALARARIKDFTFHDLRHTFASWLAMEGVPLSTIGRLLGHKTAQMTMRYAHLSPDYLADVVELLTQNKHKRGTRPEARVVIH